MPDHWFPPDGQRGAWHQYQAGGQAWDYMAGQANPDPTFNEKILKNSPIGILAYKHTGECTFANETAASILGTTVQYLRSQNYHRIESWKDSGLYELAENAIKGTDAVISDIHILSSFGKDAWLTAHCVKFKSKEEDNLLLLISDITKRKLAERAELDQRALAEALRNTAEILNSTHDYGEVLDHILTAVGSVVQHDAASIMLIENNSAHIVRLQGYEKLRSDARVAKLEFQLDKTSNLKQMFESRRSLVIPDTRSFHGGFPGIVTCYLVRVKNSSDMDKTAEELQKLIGGTTVYNHSEFLANNIKEMESGFLPILYAVAALGANVLTTVLSLILSINILERKKDFAVMKILGAPSRFLPKLIIQQAVFITLLSGLMSVLVYFPLVAMIETLSPEVSTITTPNQILIVLSVGLLMGMISSVIALSRLRKIYPLEVFYER